MIPPMCVSECVCVCVEQVLLNSSVYMGNGVVTIMCFCLVDATLLIRCLHEESHVDVTMV